MKAIVLNAYGDNAEFQNADLPQPTPDKGQVLVRIAASSVNTIDTMIRQMGQENLPLSPDLPAVLGMDFAGTVESVGEGVKDFVAGDEVYGCAGGLIGLQGALAEYMTADAQLIAHKPKTLSMREAAAIPLTGITAYEGLARAGTTSGTKLLVHGGTGGVGHLAVQLGKQMGADVFTTIASDGEAKIVSAYGAHPINFTNEKVADYVSKHTGGSGFEVVFDTVGGENLTKSFEASALNAHVSTTVSLLELDLTPVHFKGLSLHVVFMLIPMLHNHQRQAHGDILKKIAELVDGGSVNPLLDEQRFGFDQVGDAYARLMSGNAMGKVVIDIAS